jgi:small subunit ribosomal protein S1
MSDETNAPITIESLKTGMELKGTVKHLELYGAFVDIGVGQDALLHISQLGKPDVRNVEDVISVGEEITCYVLKVDKDANRIALSLEKPPEMNWDDLQEGQTLTGTVIRIEKFGVFVDIGAERPGMVHVSELADGFVKTPSDVVSNGQEVQVRIIKVNRRKRQIDLSMKEETSQAYTDYQDESDEEMPTAMAMAFQRAMKTQDGPGDSDSRKKSKNRRREQDDIISRTLRNHNNS